jgi:hypothetical protein
MLDVLLRGGKLLKPTPPPPKAAGILREREKKQGKTESVKNREIPLTEAKTGKLERFMERLQVDLNGPWQ